MKRLIITLKFSLILLYTVITQVGVNTNNPTQASDVEGKPEVVDDSILPAAILSLDSGAYLLEL